MQEITSVDWITIIMSSLSLVIATAVYIDSRMKERSRKKENTIDALSQCHTLLEEAIRMHPSLDTNMAFH